MHECTRKNCGATLTFVFPFISQRVIETVSLSSVYSSQETFCKPGMVSYSYFTRIYQPFNLSTCRYADQMLPSNKFLRMTSSLYKRRNITELQLLESVASFLNIWKTETNKQTNKEERGMKFNMLHMKLKPTVHLPIFRQPSKKSSFDG